MTQYTRVPSRAGGSSGGGEGGSPMNDEACFYPSGVLIGEEGRERSTSKGTGSHQGAKLLLKGARKMYCLGN